MGIYFEGGFMAYVLSTKTICGGLVAQIQNSSYTYIGPDILSGYVVDLWLKYGIHHTHI